MGFLHKLWDETLAGPMPDSGLGKLRKYDSFSARSSPPVNASAASRNGEMNVTRSITIIRRSSASSLRNLSLDPGSAPESPAPPSTPGTPLTRKLGHRAGISEGENRQLKHQKAPSLEDSAECFGSLTEEETILLEIYRQQ